jgi:hypothetical protein
VFYESISITRKNFIYLKQKPISIWQKINWRLGKMNKVFIIFVLFCSVLLSGCADENSEIIPAQNTTVMFDHSMTGWELYSWQIEDNWNYSILVGTSRLKTYEEVTSSEVLVTGKEKLKEVLNLFPENEYITWIGQGWLSRCWHNSYNNLELPPELIIDNIKEFCNEMNIILIVTD